MSNDNVIAFPRPKSVMLFHPTAPAWKRDLLAQWANPANWEAKGDDCVQFFWSQLFVNFCRDEDHDYWGYTAFDGPAYGETSGWLWCVWDDAEEGVLKQLIRIVEGRETRAKRKGRAKR